ncbi:PAS domain S-box protein [Leptolyngbya sp. Heron Island J]|uniref:PAS domain S-box protein n=1 Tax=Leptolyngbya sp. Heron Island J TaxID=1385935 RepID=UPI00041260FB|nr:PAS domain S-box protein [Leptolyngbya sp. Heron Island J]
MISAPLTVTPETLIDDAIARMHQTQASCVLIIDQQRRVGIFTERDLVRLVASGQPTADVVIAAVMTQQVRTILADQVKDTPSLFNLMRQYQVRHLPVVDNEGQLQGMITQQSLRQALKTTTLLKFKSVAEAMETQVICTPQSSSVLQVAQLMAAHTVSCVVITERDSQPTGIITERDIVQFQSLGIDVHQTLAQTVMSTPLLPIHPYDSLWLAHQQMTQHHVRRLVVCAPTGALVGVITQSSILQTLNPAEIQQLVELLQQELEQLRSENQILLAAKNRELEQAQIRLSEQLAAEQIEKNQAETHIQFQAGLLDAVAQAVIATDLDGQILYWNRFAESLYGWFADEVVGRSILEIIPADTTREQATEIMTYLRQSEQWSGEILVQRQDGTFFPAWVIGSPIYDHRDALVGFVGVSSDISDRKRIETERQQAEQALQQSYADLEARVEARTADLRQAEQRWRSLLDNVHLAVVGLDFDGKVTYANPFLLNLTDYTAAEVLGQDWFSKFVPTSQQSLVKKYFQQLLSQEDTSLTCQNPILTQSGSQRIIAWNNTVLHNGQDHTIGTMSIGEDITQRFAIERMKAEFISVVSHELRTPLTAIHGGLKLLAKGLVPIQSEQGLQLLRLAAEQSQRLVRLVNDILELERLASGKSSLHKHLFNTQELTGQVADLFRLTAKQAGITLKVSDPGLAIVADSDRLNQVLTNLIDNAIKFSPADTTIWLTVESRESMIDNAPAILFRLRDQGRGIPPEKCAIIFDRFVQVDASDSREKGGTGLGLTICQSIIEQHSGSIWVESTPGEGSCFCFSLPVS